jgi:hypothetical protein
MKLPVPANIVMPEKNLEESLSLRCAALFRGIVRGSTLNRLLGIPESLAILMRSFRKSTSCGKTSWGGKRRWQLRLLCIMFVMIPAVLTFLSIPALQEDEVLLCRTLYGVMKNIQELSKRKSSRTWGKDAWKKIVVVIIADGRKSVHPRVL